MIRKLKNGIHRVRGTNIDGNTISVSATLLERCYKEDTPNRQELKEAELRGMIMVFDSIYEIWRMIRPEEIQINGEWLKWRDLGDTSKRISLEEATQGLTKLGYTVEKIKEAPYRYKVVSKDFEKKFEKGVEVISWFLTISG